MDACNTLKKLTGYTRAAMLTAAFGLYGCSVTHQVEIPEKVLDTSPPDIPVRNITAFTPALVCMDQMLLDKNVNPIYVTTAPIPDFSESRGAAGYGAREMLISALSEMTRKSGAIRYVAYDRSTPDIIALNSVHPKKQNFRAPDFFIRGAVTQIDSSPWSMQKGGSANAETVTNDVHGTGYSSSNSAQISTVSLDLNMGMVSTYEIIPGISSANSLSVTKTGKSDEVSLSFWKVGALYNINEHQATAMSTALRTLSEVGVIELFGELYGVPYWQCLSKVDGQNSVDLQIQAIYQEMDKVSRMEFISQELRRQGYLEEVDLVLVQGELIMSDDFRAALAHYRADRNLFGNTLINFHLFAEIYRDSKLPVEQLKSPSGQKRPGKKATSIFIDPLRKVPGTSQDTESDIHGPS